MMTTTTSTTPSARKLGKNGPEVTALGFGCMGLSIPGPKGLKPDEERLALLSHVFNRGGHFWDTADFYADSEDLIGTWLKQNPSARKDLFLATKFGNTRDANGNFVVRNDPPYVRQQCEKSLERLGISQIDLFYMHRADKNQAIEITVGAMKELQDEGKVKYLGLSEVSANTLRRACKIVHVDAVQMEFSPFSLEVEKEGLLDACQELGVAIVAYAPLGKGFLTGSLKSRDDIPESSMLRRYPRFSEENFPKNLQLVDKLQSMAAKKGCMTAQLVMAWELQYNPLIIPIPGTTRIAGFDENMGSLKVELSGAEVEEINDAVASASIVGGRYPPGFGDQTFVDTVPLST